MSAGGRMRGAKIRFNLCGIVGAGRGPRSQALGKFGACAYIATIAFALLSHRALRRLTVVGDKIDLVNCSDYRRSQNKLWEDFDA